MDSLKVGHVEWHSSEEDGGPDVGIRLRLSATDELWFGEVCNDDDPRHPDISGCGIIHYRDGGRYVLGAIFDNEGASELMDAIAAAVRAAR